ncbi:MAG TPA: hypothetical protein VFS43_45055 [Polyangiaceae bacterium]|nr:hypothetical protein [Polyangiaceae bacterium]
MNAVLTRSLSVAILVHEPLYVFRDGSGYLSQRFLPTLGLEGSTLWVGGVCLASVLAVGSVLPAGAEAPKPATPSTGAPKPGGSSEGPQKPPGLGEENQGKRRNG